MCLKTIWLDAQDALLRFHPSFWLAYLSVSMGFAAVYCLLSLQAMLMLHLNHTFGSVLFHSALASIYQPTEPLSFDQVHEKLRPLMGTEVMAIRMVGQPVSMDGTLINATAVIVSEYVSETLSLDLFKGRLFSESDAHHHKKVCIVGYNLLDYLNPEFPVALIDDVACEVIGVIQPTPANPFLDMAIDDTIFLPAYSALRYGEDEAVQQLFVLSTLHMQDLKIKLEQTLDSYKLYWRDWSTFSQSLQTQQSQINRIVCTLSAIALLIAALNIMNVMGMQLKIRRQEFGLKKMLGLSDKTLIYSVCVEQMLLYLALSTVGVGFGLGAIYLLSSSLGWYFFVQWPSIFTCILIGLILASIFSILLVRPLKIRSIDALMRD